MADSTTVAEGSTEVAAEQVTEEPTTTESMTGDGDKAADTEKAVDTEKAADGTSSEEKKDQEKGMSGRVAKHYNDLREGGVFDRTRSRIYYQRNFNNWIKSMVIADALRQLQQQRKKKTGATVLDLCCGKGGDLLKWTKGNIKKLVCADIADVSVQQCKKRYDELVARNKRQALPAIFPAEFIAADCAEVLLTERYKDPEMLFDLCSCQFSFHYSFETHARARTMLRNACERLRPGGYFIGTIPNAYELTARLKQSEDLSFGNDVYKVTFESKDNFPLFGCKYDFHLEGVVDCPEFLIYFPLLEEMAKEFDMEVVFFKKFRQIFEENYEETDNKNLISKMQALEQYPPDKFSKTASPREEDYAHAKARHIELEGLSTGEEKRPITLGTLSKAEWEASSLYCAFAFKKAGEIEEDEEEEEEEEKKEEVANGEKGEAAEATEEGGAEAQEAEAKGEEAAEGQGEEAVME